MYICFHVKEDLSVPVLFKCCKVSQLTNKIFMEKYVSIMLNNSILMEKMITRKHHRAQKAAKN
jgi:hypothetical protein